jgi:hypothetical protein
MYIDEFLETAINSQTGKTLYQLLGQLPVDEIVPVAAKGNVKSY